jgi:hypothetical protein
MVDVPEEVTGFGPQEDLFPEAPIGDGAIRMVAWGVLELDSDPLASLFLSERTDKQLEIEQLVVNEINARGWKLSALAYKTGQYLLLGRMGGSVAMPTRPKIGQGTLQEICRLAVDWLDHGPQPTKQPER